MGQNYYAIPKLNSRLKKKILEAVNSDDFMLAKKLIPEEIHIGKSSVGWKFLFNHNNWLYFSKSIESLKSFLLSSDIINQYGESITNDSIS